MNPRDGQTVDGGRRRLGDARDPSDDFLVPALHLPCPALDEWLLPRMQQGDANARIRVHWGTRPTGALRRLLYELPDFDWPGPVLTDAGALGKPRARLLDGLIIVERADVDALVELDPAQVVRPGGTVALVCRVPRRWLHWLVGLESTRRQRRDIERVCEVPMRWALRGLYDLEQWAPIDPAGVILTLGRVRTPASARAVRA